MANQLVAGGNHVVGEVGELAIVKPLPPLPLQLWNDENGKKFKQSYFSNFPGKFVIGDSIIINPITKGITIRGRSEETLNQGGTFFGTSEIYNVEIKDSLCVGQSREDGQQRAVLFLKMKDGHHFNEELVGRLRKRIAEELTPKHVPEVILETPEIPFNANGKKMELIIKKIINKKPYNADSVQNSECLKFYHNVPELEGF